MKLIFCHVENFGRLRNFDYRFEEGLNVICRENGWGKSTFSAFLRAMFYGFSGSRRKKAEENERERYRPWQGGIYGGLLVFEAGGKTYEMTRVFGRRESEDEYELRDLETNLLCPDYSAKTGEELFCIDRESFSRTVFTGQQDCPAAATDDINALVADLTGRAGDMGDYEAAMKRLTEAANRLTPKRRTGSLYRRAEEIRRLERERTSGTGFAEKIKTCEQREREAAREEERLTAKLQGLESQIRLAAEEEEGARRALERETLTAGNREVYRRLCAARDHRKAEFERTSSFFPGRVPALAEIEQYLSACRDMERIEARIQASALDEDEQRRLSELEEEYRRMEDSPEELHGKEDFQREELHGKEDFPDEELLGRGEFPKKASRELEASPGEETRGKGEAAETESPGRGELAQTESHWMEAARGQGLLFLACCLAGAVLFAAGLTGAILIHEVLFVVVSAVGALTTAAGVYFYLTNIKINIKSEKSNNANIETDSEKEPAGQSWNREADDDTGLAGPPAAQDRRDARREYLKLLEKERRTDELYAEWSGVRKPILDFLKELGFSPREDLRTQLETLRDAADDCEDAGKLLREAESELRLFESEMSAKGISLSEEKNGGGNTLPEAGKGYGESSAENTLPEAEKGYGESEEGQGRKGEKAADSGARMRNYRREADETHAALMRCREKRSDYGREMEELCEEYEEWEYSMQCLETMKAQQEAESVRYRRVIAAAACLSQAKEAMTSRYADPIASHFRRYWEMITGYSAAGIRIDAESKVTIEERGKQRQASLLSAGYRDLAGICLRVALADAMYPPGRRERPPLIMDDPFTGLDDEKMGGAMRFLRETGKTYQILYFTCSASRC